MAINQISVERFSLVSSKPFAEIVAAIEKVVGHPNMPEWGKAVAAAKDHKELEAVVQAALGPSGFMEFVRFNLGQILEKAQGAGAPKILRIVIGNPLVMKDMAKEVHDAASYAPVTILIDERADGVHLSYDLMAGYLSPYGSLVALDVARALDAKVQSLLTAAAN